MPNMRTLSDVGDHLLQTTPQELGIYFPRTERDIQKLNEANRFQILTLMRFEHQFVSNIRLSEQIVHRLQVGELWQFETGLKSTANLKKIIAHYVKLTTYLNSSQEEVDNTSTRLLMFH